jgi:hypothetical protein
VNTACAIMTGHSTASSQSTHPPSVIGQETATSHLRGTGSVLSTLHDTPRKRRASRACASPSVRERCRSVVMSSQGSCQSLSSCCEGGGARGGTAGNHTWGGRAGASDGTPVWSWMLTQCSSIRQATIPAEQAEAGRRQGTQHAVRETDGGEETLRTADHSPSAPPI